MSLFWDKMESIIDFPGQAYETIYEIATKSIIVTKLIWYGSSLAVLMVLLVSTGILRRYLPFDFNDKTYYLILFGSLLLIKWPELLMGDINQDEAQWIANASRIYYTMPDYHQLDSYSSGILNTILITIIPLLKWKLNYFSLRLFNLVCILFPTIIFIYKSCRIFLDKTESRIVIIPLLLFHLFLSNWNLLFLSSECIPNLLFSLSIYFSFQYFHANQLKHLIIALFIIGMMPFAKLQIAPMAFFLGVFNMFISSRRILPSIFKKNSIHSLISYALLVFSPFLFSVFYFLFLYINGSLNDFIRSYILTNLHYSNVGNFEDDRSIIQRVFQSLQIILSTFRLSGLIFCIFSISFLCIIRIGSKKSNYLYLLYLSLILILAALFIISKSGNGFLHYFLFLTIPVTLFLFSVVLVYGLPMKQTSVLILFIYGTALISKGSPGLSYISTLPKLNNLTGKRITRHPGKKNEQFLAIWGWRNDLYLQTGLTHATRETFPYFQMKKQPFSAYFRTRYINDLERIKPELFVDAVASESYFKEEKYRHWNYPYMKAYISKNYARVDSFDAIIVYKRK